MLHLSIHRSIHPSIKVELRDLHSDLGNDLRGGIGSTAAVAQYLGRGVHGGTRTHAWHCRASRQPARQHEPVWRLGRFEGRAVLELQYAAPRRTLPVPQGRQYT